MAISRTIWKNPFTENNVPSWTCPTCYKGTLIGDRKTVKSVESITSKRSRDDDGWEPEFISGSFIGSLKCNNPNCEESVLMVGNMHVDGEYEYDEQYADYHQVYSEFLFPNAFVPTLHLFPIHPEVPIGIKKAIIDSFKLYWIDASSCGNKIRIVVELIMDEQKVQKNYIQQRKRKVYNLHKRLEFFKAIKHEEGELLMAIKWIGNGGSHSNDTLTKDDILDAYEILEHVTTKLYEKDSHRLKKLSKEINKKKKPLGSKKQLKSRQS